MWRATASHSGLPIAERVDSHSWIGEISTRGGELAERLGEVAVDDLPGVARNGPHVDVDVDDVGDRVRLLAAVDDVGGDRRVRAGVGDPGVVRGQGGDGVVDAGRVDERGAQVVGQVHRGDPSLPQVVEVGVRSEGDQPADDLGRGDERVVGPVGHRSVPRRAVDAQAAPGEALLGHVDRDVAHPVGTDAATSRRSR